MDGEKEIRVRLDTEIDDYNINWLSIDKIIDKLNEIKDLYEDRYSDIVMSIENYYGEITFQFHGVRKENDEEYEHRIEYEKHWENMKEMEKSHKKEEDRKTFEMIKEKYGW